LTIPNIDNIDCKTIYAFSENLQNGVYFCLEMSSKRSMRNTYTANKKWIASGYEDGTIDIHDKATGRFLFTLHNSPSWQNHLPSSEFDGSDNFWAPSGGQICRKPYLKSKLNENNQITQLKFYGESLLLSSTANGKVCLRNLETETTVQIFEMDGWISDLDCDGQKVVAATSHSLKAWDLDQNRLICEYKIPKGIKALAITDQLAYVLVDSDSVAILDLTPNAKEICLVEKQVHEVAYAAREYYSLVVHGDLLFSSAQTIKILNRYTLETVGEISDAKNYRSLTIQDGVLFAGAYDGRRFCLQAWNLRTMTAIEGIEKIPYDGKKFTVQDGIIVTGALEGRILIYDFTERANFQYFPLLKDLDITTPEDYFTILGCQPHDLAKIGIMSQNDLDILLGALRPLEIERIVDLDEEDGLANYRKVHSKALSRKEALMQLTEELVKVNSNSLKVRQFQRKLNSIIESCQDKPALICKAFNSENYNALAFELNQLVKKAKIEKLKNYIQQGQPIGRSVAPYLHLVWMQLRWRECYTISALNQENPNLIAKLFTVHTLTSDQMEAQFNLPSLWRRV
jgi:hypothetical protein